MKNTKSFSLTDFSNAARISNFRINESGELIKREGGRMLYNFGEEIRGEVNLYDISYVFVGTTLYLVEGELPRPVGTIYEGDFSEGEKVTMFTRGDILYLIGGGVYYSYNRATDEFGSVSFYAPVVMKDIINAVPSTDFRYEELNTISARMCVTIAPDPDCNTYFLWGYADYVFFVKADGKTVDPSTYKLSSNEDQSWIVFSDKELLDTKEIVVEYYSPPYPGDQWRMRDFHGLRSYLYQGKEATRLFLYGGALGADIIYSEVGHLDPKKPVDTLDYFPSYARFTVGDGTKPVTDIVNLDGMTVIATRDAFYGIQLSTQTTPHGIIVAKFTPESIMTEIGVLENTGCVVLDRCIYFMSDRGLHKLYYDVELSMFVYKKLEFAEYAKPSPSEYPTLKLYLNKESSELWCYNWNVAYILDLKNGYRYKFQTYPMLRMFTHNGIIAFVDEYTLWIYDSNMTDDENVGYEAVFESRPLDLGDFFTLKDIHSFTAAFDKVSNSKLDVTLTSDKGIINAFSLTPSENGGPSPEVIRVHTRLGNAHHVTVRLVSPSDGAGTNIRGIGFEFSEKGALQ